ncbi:MAG: HlyD family efflux transporter periplasmic adaptor subunit [Bacteroidota bacterium]
MPETLIKNAEQIVLREQDEIQEIIGHPPSWILRWGITVVLLIVAIFGLMSWLIKYPDILPAPVMITTENPVIRVVAKTSGKLEQVFVSDQDSVVKNQPIVLLESNAKWLDIQQLASFLKQLERKQNLANLQVPENLAVGELQATYTRLVQQIKEQQYHLRQENEALKIAAAQKQITHYENLNQSLQKQIAIFKKEVALSESNYTTTKGLYESGAASLVEVEGAEASYLQYQRQLESMQSQMISNQVTTEQLKTQIADIQQGRQDGLQTRQFALEENLRKLRNDIQIWEQTYLVKAPIEGQISMTKIWSPQQFVQANAEIFTILPRAGAGEIIGKAMMPATGIGKVRTGMTANINLDAYPQQEYGILKAQIQNIALLPESQAEGQLSYLIELELINGLMTTYDKSLQLQQEMSGTAEIITEDKRILERVLEQILDILKNN